MSCRAQHLLGPGAKLISEVQRSLVESHRGISGRSKIKVLTISTTSFDFRPQNSSSNTVLKISPELRFVEGVQMNEDGLFRRAEPAPGPTEKALLYVRSLGARWWLAEDNAP